MHEIFTAPPEYGVAFAAASWCRMIITKQQSLSKDNVLLVWDFGIKLWIKMALKYVLIWL